MNNPLQSPMNAPIIAFLTDFGLDDPYVGIMKGVILGLCPQARLIDVSHGVKPQNITQAAFMLEAAYRYFPAGTIFVCVVDPGVGSSRSAVALQANGYTFIGPNNGLFAEILMEDTPFEAVELTNQAYQLPQKSATFHGRDVFAPVAAHLANRVPLRRLGEPTDTINLGVSLLRLDSGRADGEIINIDHFGNVISAIGKLRWLDDHTLELSPKYLEAYRFDARTATVRVGDVTINGIVRTYSDVQSAPTEKQFIALVGSSGYLEVAVNGGNAATQLNIHDTRPTQRVQLYWQQNEG